MLRVQLSVHSVLVPAIQPMCMFALGCSAEAAATQAADEEAAALRQQVRGSTAAGGQFAYEILLSRAAPPATPL